MEMKYVPSRASLIGHDHFEIIAILMRGEQIQLYRRLVLSLHFLTDEDEAVTSQALQAGTNYEAADRPRSFGIRVLYNM